jgi:contractile injection system tape measure protein
MQEQGDHRVKRLVFAMTCADQPAAFAARSRLFAMVDDAVVPALDEALSRHADGHVHHIERVEIDLGRLTLEHLDARRLRAAIVDEVSRHLLTLPAPAAQAIPAAVSLADTLATFLATGVLPWQAAGRRLADLEAETMALMAADAAALVERLRPLLREPAASARFVLQFSAAFLDWMAARLQAATPERAGALVLALSAELSPSATTLVEASVVMLRAAAHLSAGATAAQWQEQARQFAQTAEETVPLRRDRADTVSPGDQRTDRGDGERRDADRGAAAADAAAADDTAASETLYVGNAGIVLLHPFLPRLFSHLALIDARQFVTPAAQERAVHLLHFLATGAEHPEEHELPLHKLLCGVALTRPVARMLPLQQSEKDEAEHLLAAVIGHWAKLKATSPHGLRDAFLRRDGKLQRTPDAWVLTVEQRGIDILLDHLPWALSVVKLPWMARPLRVEWG